MSNQEPSNSSLRVDVVFNWMTSFNIQKNNQAYNLIDDYGSLSYNDVLQHALTYVLPRMPFRSSTASQAHSQKLGNQWSSWRQGVCHYETLPDSFG
jgi:hypothetical protein